MQAWAFEENGEIQTDTAQLPVVAIVLKEDGDGEPWLYPAFVDAEDLRVLYDEHGARNSVEQVFYADDPKLAAKTEELRQLAIELEVARQRRERANSGEPQPHESTKVSA